MKSIFIFVFFLRVKGREHVVTGFSRRFVLCISKSHCPHCVMEND